MAFKVKEERFLIELQFVSPNILIVLGHFSHYCKSIDKECLITNVLDDFGVTEVHSSGRGIDCRSIGWTDSEINGAICFVRHCCGHLGALSMSTNMPNVVLHHCIKGGAPHFHFQTKE